MIFSSTNDTDFCSKRMIKTHGFYFRDLFVDTFSEGNVVKRE